jgi:hypothetical protein
LAGYFDDDKARVTEFTNAVLAYPPLPRFLLLAFEFGTRRHYVESIQEQTEASGDALYHSLSAIIACVALTDPSFAKVALELSEEGAAKLGIA